MPELSVLIPGRNEEWLARTCADVLEHSDLDTEVIAVIDGEHKGEVPLPHPRLRVITLEASIGQRAATNLAAREARGRFVMKLDAHCSLAQGFDRAIVSALEGHPDWTLIPQQRNLHVFDWICDGCGHRTYMGPSLEQCERCKGTSHHREVVWRPRSGTRTDFWRFDHELHFQYKGDWQGRRQEEGDIADTLSCLGACFAMSRERYGQLGGMDEAHGSWGQMGTEVGCKAWLSGGRMVVHRGTWFAHMFRTRADFSFPYQMQFSAQDRAREYSRALWLNDAWPGQVLPLAWLINKFKPLPGWHDTDAGRTALAQIRASERRFYQTHPRVDREHAYA